MAKPATITNNLAEVIEGLRLTESTKAAVGNVIAETYNRWFFTLKGSVIRAPGDGAWPVGRIVKLDQPGERYVYPDERGAMPPGWTSSGRSLGAWRHTQRGLNIVAINDAADARRRLYAGYAHKKGEPLAKNIAWDLWVQEFERSRPEFERVIEQGIERG